MEKQSSDTLKIAGLLTFIGGFLEIYSFLLKGKVFATTITANIILIMYNIYSFNFSEIIKYLLPIIFFSFGIVIVELLRKRLKKSSIHWREYILLLELLLVVLIYIFKDVRYNMLTISMISFMSAIQIQTFRKIDNLVYMSTMCTGNTRKIIESLLKKDMKKAKIFMLIVFSFSLGVIFGALSIEYIFESAILLLIIPLIVIIYLVHYNK
ncbi:MAG: DUF1275 domain-containing protein [Oceanivirga sp.]|nr:DUF1275 domain-containing protein [Oceanivirga sp.]